MTLSPWRFNIRCLAHVSQSGRQGETIAFQPVARNCGNWRYNIYLLTLVLWHFWAIHPRLNQKRMKAWPQKEKKKFLFITESWTIHLVVFFHQSSSIASLVETASLAFWSHIERLSTTTHHVIHERWLLLHCIDKAKPEGLTWRLICNTSVLQCLYLTNHM